MFAPAPEAPNTGMLGLGRERTRRIHAFHDAAFWLSLLTPVLFAPVVLMMTGNVAIAMAAAAGSLAFACLVAGTVTDLMSMRIPNPLTALSFLPAILLWVAYGMGFESVQGAGFGRMFYTPFLTGPEASGTIVPELWTGTLWREIAMSVLAMVLVFIPLLLSFIIGAMGGGDAKFMPPLALFFGWSLAFDFLFLTFLFGGVFAIPMIAFRQVCRSIAAKKGKDAHPEIVRIARMKAFAYAPAIAAAGVVCFAAKWQGIVG